MGIEKAKAAIDAAVYEVRLAQVGVGRGSGGRELALAATKIEEAELWLQAAERAQEVAKRNGELAPPTEPA